MKLPLVRSNNKFKNPAPTKAKQLKSSPIGRTVGKVFKRNENHPCAAKGHDIHIKPSSPMEARSRYGVCSREGCGHEVLL